MPAIFENIGNFTKEGTCHFCGNDGETLDVTTTSELLQGVPMCLRCFRNIIPSRAPRDGQPAVRKAARTPRRNGAAATHDGIPEATLAEPIGSGTPTSS